PSAEWTPTNLTYIEDMPATYRSGPTGCPGDLPPGVCPTTRTTITRASPYSAAAPLPTDLVAPVSTFSSTDGIRVIGEQPIGGRGRALARVGRRAAGRLGGRRIRPVLLGGAGVPADRPGPVMDRSRTVRTAEHRGDGGPARERRHRGLRAGRRRDRPSRRDPH